MSIRTWLTRFRNVEDSAALRRAEAEADMTPGEQRYASGDLEAIQADESTAEHTGGVEAEGSRLGE